MMKEYTPSLDRLTQLARGRSDLLAGPLSLYKEQEGLDDAHLAAQLGCEVKALTRLALCERPRSAPHFRKDVERIARYIQADMLQLALLIRAAESREAFSLRTNTAPPALLAARDYEEAGESSTGDEDELLDE